MALASSTIGRRVLLAAGVLVLGALAQQAGLDLSALGLGSGASGVGASAPLEPVVGRSDSSSPAAPVAGDTDRVLRAFETGRSGFMVTLDARVVKSLPDDRDGSRHQRFLIELAGGHTLLVAHNIDLAERIPLERDDAIRIRGQYEWNERGGVLHWTHHDPGGRRVGGWIEHEGARVE